MVDVRDSLRKIIEQSGMKQSVVASRSSLSPQQLCDITRKRRRLDANELMQLCTTLNISPNDLLSAEKADQAS